MSDKSEKIVRLCAKAFSSDERTNVESTWDLLSEFLLNNQSGNFNGQAAKGARRTRRVYDSTAILAAHDLAAAIHSTLTSPAIKWSRFRYSLDSLNNDTRSKIWLESANKKFHDFLNTSNFDTEISKAYKNYTSMANMALMMEELPKDKEGQFTGFNFTAWHLSQVAWSENSLGRVDTVYRRFKMTLKIAFERWGTKLDPQLLELMETDPSREIEVILCIQARNPKDIKLNESGIAPIKHRPFEATYIDKTHGTILEENGYYEFPLMVARWDTAPGEVYGRGQGHIALPDVRTLNEVKKLGLQAIAKAIDPPLMATKSGVMGKLSLRPGSINYVKDVDKSIKPFNTTARFDVTNFNIEQLQESIRKIFFLDKLMLPPRTQTGEMTAFEISVRQEEMQRVIGPTLGRINAELLDPLTKRAFNMMLRSGILGELPEKLKELGAGLEVEYVNQLARAQRLSEISNVQTWVQEIMMLAQADPSILDVLDMDGIARHSAKIRGIPEVVSRTPKEVEQLRQQRAQQQQQQQQLDMASQGADIAAKLGGGGNGQTQ